MNEKAKNRNEILHEIIRDAKKYPKDWKAVFGKDKQLLSDDYYLFHPKVGLYLLKEYSKNPYVRKGVGARIGRHIDEHIENEISKQSNNFGIIQSDIRKITHHLNKGAHPRQIIDAAITAIKGKNMGLSIPLRGHGSTAHDSFDYLRNELSIKQKNIERNFKKLATDDGLYNSY